MAPDQTPPAADATPSAYEQLPKKRRAFVDALCADPNISATQAARTAGYPDAGARVEGHRLLTNANVRKALAERLKDTAPTTEELAARWDRVSRATLDDFFTKQVVQESTKVWQPLGDAIAELEGKIAFDLDYAARSAALLGLKDEALSQHMATAEQQATQQRLKILRWQMELERDPLATREIAGPPVAKQVLVLDLVKAQAAGVLDLAKAIKPGQHGTTIELRDPDAALDKLARIAGAYEKDNEQSRAQPALTAHVTLVPAVGSVPIATSEKEVNGV